MPANITLPRILRIGAGASRELVASLAQLGYTRPCFVTDPYMVESGMLDRVAGPLAAAGVPWSVFGDCVPDPTTDSVSAALDLLRAGEHDCLVALGGGSSLDTAKAVAVLARHGGEMRDYKVPAVVDSALPVIAIPTTAGTGSEVTRAAVITDSAGGEKMLCMGLGLVPVAALVDFELTLSMPRRLTADTGLDSLCHALEAYVSRRANLFTDSVALTALATISRYLRRACDEPQDREAREAMMLAATQGGMAFANASVTLIHGMSRPLGAHFHVPHGLSNAMLLPEVTAWSVPGNPERYAHAARVMGMARESDSDSLALDRLVAGLRQLNADLAVPGPRAWGIDPARWEASLEVMAQQALASGSPANNPREPSGDDIVQLYRRVWAG